MAVQNPFHAEVNRLNEQVALAMINIERTAHELKELSVGASDEAIALKMHALQGFLGILKELIRDRRGTLAGKNPAFKSIVWGDLLS
jgi:hypothetical protein